VAKNENCTREKQDISVYVNLEIRELRLNILFMTVRVLDIEHKITFNYKVKYWKRNYLNDQLCNDI
jgi:hypothetical protein